MHGWVALCLGVLMCGSALCDAQRVTQFDTCDTPGNWEGHGIAVSTSPDCVEGDGALMLKGSGHIRLSPALLKRIDVARYDRMLMNVKIVDGQVSDFGAVSNGFPLAGRQGRYPRWGEYDESTPSGVWMDYSLDLHLPEWFGGSAKYVHEHPPAFSVVYTPGRGNTAVLVDNIRLVNDPVRIGDDWLPPIKPLGIVREGGKVRYEKAVEVKNVSDQPVDVEVRFSQESLKKFRGSVDPPTVELAPGRTQVFTVKIDVPEGLEPLEHEKQTLEVIPAGDRALVQRIHLLVAAPCPPVKYPFTLTQEEARKARVPAPATVKEVRLPKHPCVWMTQSALNSNGRCAQCRAGNQKLAGFDRLKCPECGAVQEGTRLTGGMWHRQLIQQAQGLGMAYQKTRDVRYAQQAREIFLAYARGYHSYALDRPLTLGSSHIAPSNATYILGSVIMAPMSRALDLIWDSGVLSDEDKRAIVGGFLQPAALEMMKVNPGMTNMQDAMNNAMFTMGLLADDPNLVAFTLYGSHGLNAKIDSVFDEDGATPESIAACYHFGALSPVLAQVKSIRNAGLAIPLDFDRLEKARELMGLVRMPDGRVPNRGDQPTVGFRPKVLKPAPARAAYGSVQFNHWGMTVLREGGGPDALYVALDHRPPAVTHSHHDKLSIVFYGKGELLGVDDGSLYNIDTNKQRKLPNWPRRSRWGGHSLVHNTITVDQTSQQYGGGRLLYYHGEKGEYQAVAASTDNVYKGVVLERNIVMLGGVMVMVDRCMSEGEHTYDWTHHSFGKLAAPEGLAPRDALGEAGIYKTPEDVKWGAPAGDLSFVWQRPRASLNLTVLAEPDMKTECGTAMGWANRSWIEARQEAPFALVRRKGKNVMFVTVFEPFKGETPGIKRVSRAKVKAGSADDEAVGLEVEKHDGETLFYLVSFTGGGKTCGPIKTDQRCFAMRRP